MAEVFGPGVFLILQHLHCLHFVWRKLVATVISLLVLILGWLADFTLAELFFFFSFHMVEVWSSWGFGEFFSGVRRCMSCMKSVVLLMIVRFV